MSKMFIPLFRSNFGKLSTHFGINLNMRRKFADDVLDLGKAKENVYFLKKEQEKLRMLRSKLRKEEKVLTAKIRENKRAIKQLEQECSKSNEVNRNG